MRFPLVVDADDVEVSVSDTCCIAGFEVTNELFLLHMLNTVVSEAQRGITPIFGVCCSSNRHRETRL